MKKLLFTLLITVQVYGVVADCVYTKSCKDVPKYTIAFENWDTVESNCVVEEDGVLAYETGDKVIVDFKPLGHHYITTDAPTNCTVDLNKVIWLARDKYEKTGVTKYLTSKDILKKKNVVTGYTDKRPKYQLTFSKTVGGFRRNFNIKTGCVYKEVKILSFRKKVVTLVYETKRGTVVDFNAPDLKILEINPKPDNCTLEPMDAMMLAAEYVNDARGDTKFIINSNGVKRIR